MSTKLTYEQVKQYLINKGDIQKFWVESNPFGEGKRTLLEFRLDKNEDVSSFIENQDNIAGVDYSYSEYWEDYEGTFELDEEPISNIKPTPYKVGDVVEIKMDEESIESYWSSHLDSDTVDMLRKLKRIKIVAVKDTSHGLSYKFDVEGKLFRLPHYVLHPTPVETVKIGEMTYNKAEFEAALQNLKPLD